MLIKRWQFWVALLIVGGVIALVGININGEPHFKITKEINGEIFEVKNELVWFDENTSFSKEQDGVKWLEENCECQEQVCSFHFNYSKRVKITPENAEKFISVTYDGPIWFFTDEDGHNIAEFYEKDAEFVEDCIPCIKYQCEDYIINVEGKIK